MTPAEYEFAAALMHYEEMVQKHPNGGKEFGKARRRVLDLFRIAARSPAPSNVIRHPGKFLVRVEKPGGLRFNECSAPTLDEAAEGVGLQRSCAPILEAREAPPIDELAMCECGHVKQDHMADGVCLEIVGEDAERGTSTLCECLHFTLVPRRSAPPDQHQDAEPMVDAEQESMIQSYAMIPPLTLLPQTVRDASFLARLVLLQRARLRRPLEAPTDTPLPPPTT